MLDLQGLFTANSRRFPEIWDPQNVAVIMMFCLAEDLSLISWDVLGDLSQSISILRRIFSISWENRSDSQCGTMAAPTSFKPKSHWEELSKLEKLSKQELSLPGPGNAIAGIYLQKELSHPNDFAF